MSTGQHPQRREDPEPEAQAQIEGPPPGFQNPVEVIIHNAAVLCPKIQLPDGTEMRILQFITPGTTYSIKLDDGGRKVVRDLLSDGIHIASPTDLPRLG